MKISKRKILISLTEEDLKKLDFVSKGYSRSGIIAMAIRMMADSKHYEDAPTKVIENDI